MGREKGESEPISKKGVYMTDCEAKTCVKKTQNFQDPEKQTNKLTVSPLLESRRKRGSKDHTDTHADD